MQVVVDPKMRFLDIWSELTDSMTHLSILRQSGLFEECENSACLIGSKLKAALDGSEVGEYIIGDAGYPLLRWLLTPYQEEDLSDSVATHTLAGHLNRESARWTQRMMMQELHQAQGMKTRNKEHRQEHQRKRSLTKKTSFCIFQLHRR